MSEIICTMQNIVFQTVIFRTQFIAVNKWIVLAWCIFFVFCHNNWIGTCVVFTKLIINVNFLFGFVIPYAKFVVVAGTLLLCSSLLLCLHMVCTRNQFPLPHVKARYPKMWEHQVCYESYDDKQGIMNERFLSLLHILLISMPLAMAQNIDYLAFASSTLLPLSDNGASWVSLQPFGCAQSTLWHRPRICLQL